MPLSRTDRPSGARTPPLDRRNRYLIVGAGPAGLAQARAFKQAGIAFDLVERHRGLGGIWDIKNPGTPLYASARFISSKRRSAFLGFPMPADYPDYPLHGQVLNYLETFAEAHDLASHMAFGVSVEKAEPEAGEWKVRLHSGEERYYRGLVCANGMTWEPESPNIPGSFEGELEHARSYEDPAVYRGKRVLVLGGGNTGCDIACDIAKQAAATFLSLRRGYHVIPRHIFGLPADVFGASASWLPIRLQQGISEVLLRLIQGDAVRHGWPKPDHRIYESHPIINSEIFDLTASGRIQVKPDIAAFQGRDVRFVDGSCLEVDVVLLASGYRMSLPFLDPKFIEYREGRIANFLTVFSRRLPNLFTLGFLSTNAGVFGDLDRLAHIVAWHVRDQADRTQQAQSFRELVEGEAPDLSGGIRFVTSRRHAVYVHNPAFRAYVEALRRRMDWPKFPG